MGFKELTLKRNYNSENMDVVNDFFIPVLKSSKSYKRVSAYYSSSSFKLMAEGLGSMITNEGMVKILVACVTSDEDYDAIVAAKKTPEEILKSMKIDDELALKSLMRDQNVAALGYLIATNRLEIKFVICKSEGIFHLKFGIFTDGVGDKISFTGSLNETYKGLTENIEQFKVFRSWIPEENKHLEDDSAVFDKYWAGIVDKKHYLIQDMPDKVKNVIVRAYKESGTWVTQVAQRLSVSSKQLPPLWPHQTRAQDLWVKNKHCGLVEMATGTGKTKLAISCINKLADEHPDELLVVIGCPTNVLVDQWNTELRDYLGDFEIITTTDSTRDEIYRILTNKQKNKRIFIGSYVSLSKPWFTNVIIPKCRRDILFIADEAHWLGARDISNALSSKYVYRLGLTATPLRYFDEFGTSTLLNYFKTVVYKYTLDEAIRDGWLTPYEYHPYFAHLSEEETQEYAKLTKQYARQYRVALSAKDKRSEDTSLTAILNKRSRLVKKAKDKINVFKEVLEKLKSENKLNSLLVYVEDGEQLAEYLTTMDELGMRYRRIVSETKKKDRDVILADLSENKIDCVIAMKVLDEGVDIKRLRRAIFVASSGNPKQFIQRRGRVLRKAENKKLAEIYDICVLADAENQIDEFQEVEKKVLKNEFKRLAIFSMSARNKAECYAELESVGKPLNISIYEIINTLR